MVQVDAVHDDIGIFETAAERFTRWDAHDFLAIERVEHHDRGRLDRLGEHGFAQSQPLEHVEHIGPQLNAVADRTEFRSFFEHAHRPPLTTGREANGGAAISAAEKDDGMLRWHFFYRLGLAALGQGRVLDYRFLREIELANGADKAAWGGPQNERAA